MKVDSDISVVVKVKVALNNLSEKTYKTLTGYEDMTTSQERKEYRYSILTLAFCSHIFDYAKEEYLNDCRKLGSYFYHRANEEIFEYHQIKLDI